MDSGTRHGYLQAISTAALDRLLQSCFDASGDAAAAVCSYVCIMHLVLAAGSTPPGTLSASVVDTLTELLAQVAACTAGAVALQDPDCLVDAAVAASILVRRAVRAGDVVPAMLLPRHGLLWRLAAALPTADASTTDKVLTQLELLAQDRRTRVALHEAGLHQALGTGGDSDTQRRLTRLRDTIRLAS